MTNTDIVDLQEALTKSGAELFKELYRVYPTSDPEDYFKNGQWKNEVMKTDLILMESHRREAGAPDVPDLEDIKVPNLPQATAVTPLSYGSSLVGVLKPALKPAMVVPAPDVKTLGGAAPGTSAPVVEIRLIALFVAKWKLDPVTAKTMLAKLTPVHRRYVIQNFKATTTGMEATKELETFIAQCEEDKTWDAASAATETNGAPTLKPTASGTAMIAAAKAGLAPKPVGATVGVKAGGAAVAPNPALSGLKRSLTPVAANPAWAANKRPPMWGGKGMW